MRDSNKKLAKLLRAFRSDVDYEKKYSDVDEAELSEVEEDAEDVEEYDSAERLDEETLKNAYYELAELLDAEKKFRYDNDVAELVRYCNDYEEFMVDCLMKDDLEAIKTAYPEITEKSVAEFGDEYNQLVETHYDPIAAYEAIRAKQARETKNPPPNIGAVNNTDGQEKDYYSPEEADKLTREDFKKNPRLLDVVRKSMLKWNT